MGSGDLDTAGVLFLNCKTPLCVPLNIKHMFLDSFDKATQEKDSDVHHQF